LKCVIRMCNGCYWFNNVEKFCRLTAKAQSICKLNKFKNFDNKNFFSLDEGKKNEVK